MTHKKEKYNEMGMCKDKIENKKNLFVIKLNDMKRDLNKALLSRNNGNNDELLEERNIISNDNTQIDVIVDDSDNVE